LYALCTAAVVQDSAAAAAAAAELETAVEAAADSISEHCSCVLVFRQPQQCPITFLAPTADADSLYSDVFLRASSSGSSNNSRRKGSGKGKANSSSKQQQQQHLEDAQSDTATATTAVTVTTGSDDLLTDDTSAVDVAAALRLPGFQVIWQLTMAVLVHTVDLRDCAVA
jgi:hypothetical protein